MWWTLFVYFVISQLNTGIADRSNNLIETECKSNDDCEEFRKSSIVLNTTCLNSRCICFNEARQSVECVLEKVQLSNEIGGKCPCTDIPGIICHKEMCLCKPNFIPSDDTRRCLPKNVNLGDICELNAQCTRNNAFSQCINETCSCQPEYIVHNSTCLSKIALNQKCDDDIKCNYIANTVCLYKQCVCTSGFITKQDNTGCLPSVSYNDGCIESRQCQAVLGMGGVCENGKCVCNENFVRLKYNVGNKTKYLCEDRIAFGDSCHIDSDCYQSSEWNEPSMICFLKECICSSNFEQKNRYCVRKIEEVKPTYWMDNVRRSVQNIFYAGSGSQKFSFNAAVVATTIVLALLLGN